MAIESLDNRLARQRRPLAQLLASPKPLPPPRPADGFVGASHNLPSLIGYGRLEPKPVEGTMFTGAQVAHPQSGLVQPLAPPPTSPSPSTPPSSTGATLASLGLLTPTPHGGPATPTLPGPTGATVPPQQPPPPPAQPTLTTAVHPRDVGYDARPTPENPNPTPENPAPPHLPTPERTLSTILLSLVGQRYNPSSPKTYLD